MPPAPTIAQIQSLYHSTITASSRFASYNFHSYFLRRTDLVFRPVLDSLSPPAGAENAASSPDPAALAEFYETQTKELEVIKRASEISRMFKGPELVVEHASPITSGGGAGAEASAGGGGQPV